MNPVFVSDADDMARAIAPSASSPSPSSSSSSSSSTAVASAASVGATGDALPTLAALVAQHNAHVTSLKEQNDKQRREAVAAVGDATDGLANAVNDGVARIFVAQRKIDHEARQLQSNAAKFAKQTAAWIKLVDQFNTALKEVGDIQTWAKTIEADMQVVCATLESIQRDNREPPAPAAVVAAAAPPAPLVVVVAAASAPPPAAPAPAAAAPAPPQ